MIQFSFLNRIEQKFKFLLAPTHLIEDVSDVQYVYVSDMDTSD
jgi:hypothetical protein